MFLEIEANEDEPAISIVLVPIIFIAVRPSPIAHSIFVI